MKRKLVIIKTSTKCKNELNVFFLSIFLVVVVDFVLKIVKWNINNNNNNNKNSKKKKREKIVKMTIRIKTTNNMRIQHTHTQMYNFLRGYSLIIIIIIYYMYVNATTHTFNINPKKNRGKLIKYRSIIISLFFFCFFKNFRGQILFVWS
jgi:hypothetical protein